MYLRPMNEYVEESETALLVARLERAAVDDPARYSCELSWELGRLGDLYRSEGIDSEWLACYQRAVDLMRVRVGVRGATATDHWDFQQHLYNLATVAQNTDQWDVAEAAITEALDRAQQLDPETAPLRLFYGVYLSTLSGRVEACRKLSG